MADDFEEEKIEKPSKSSVKRALEAMQTLGTKFARLPEKTLAEARLPEEVMEALRDYAKMRSFGAQRRQLQLIGQKMARLMDILDFKAKQGVKIYIMIYY